jgi:hypothetical protein
MLLDQLNIIDEVGATYLIRGSTLVWAEHDRIWRLIRELYGLRSISQ